MADEYVDPVEGVKSSPRIEGRSRPSMDVPSQHATLSGQVVAVRRRAGHHEGEHILDTSVGAEEHTEVVIRVEKGELNDLVGKQVVVNFKP